MPRDRRSKSEAIIPVTQSAFGIATLVFSNANKYAELSLDLQARLTKPLAELLSEDVLKQYGVYPDRFYPGSRSRLLCEQPNDVQSPSFTVPDGAGGKKTYMYDRVYDLRELQL